MKLRAKLLGLEAGGKPIVILNHEDAEDLGIKSLGRVKLASKNKKLTAIVNLTTRVVSKGHAGIYNEVRSSLDLKENDELEVEVAGFPGSLQHIRDRLKGKRLNYDEIFEIVKDVVGGNLSETEISSFVTNLHDRGLNLDEATSLTLAMVRTGKSLKLNKKTICDKHSIGGVPGDKASLIVVPIIASAGLTIPKTSSRAITSAGGTADRAEALMPVNLDIEEMKRVVEKTNGCIAWGGSLNIAPADDIFIQAEYPLSIDPLLFPSIMSKKKAVGANRLVIDIPCGRGTKVKTIGDGDLLAKDFIELGKKLGIKTRCTITYGEQPLGYTIGPALEAREALEVLTKKKIVPDLTDKSLDLAGILLEMCGRKDGRKVASEILNSGKAEKKLREIIFEQGGDSEIKPEEIEPGDFGLDFRSENSGLVLWINNSGLIEVARAAGAPKDKRAGIELRKKIGDLVKKDEILFRVYCERSRKLKVVREILDEERLIGVGKRAKMLIHEVKELPVHKRTFILER
jgi:AMP phosphorylase